MAGIFDRFRRDPNANEHRGWFPFGIAVGQTYEGKVLQNPLGVDSEEVYDLTTQVARELFAEERQLIQTAVRMVGREKDEEVMRFYWQPQVNERTVVQEWGRAGYDWSQVAPFRLPKRSDIWEWWNGQNEPGVVALAAMNDQEPIGVGPSGHVLVVTDNRKVEKSLTRGNWGHITGTRLRDLLNGVVVSNGLLSVVTVGEFDQWLTDAEHVDLLGRYSHVIVGATRDVDTPTRLAREWCRASGWSSGMVDRVAESWLGVIDYEKLMLDLTNLQYYWVGMERD